MTSIGRLVLRGAFAAGAIGATMALALAPQPGLATTRTVDETSIATQIVHKADPAPSAACLAAKDAFIAARKADIAEDEAERNLEKTGTNTNDPAEDQAERANFKSLLTAMLNACKPDFVTRHKHNVAPTAACTSAKATLKAFITQRIADEKAEAAGTEGTEADQAEDAAARAQMKSLFQDVAAACGFTKTFHHDDTNHDRDHGGW